MVKGKKNDHGRGFKRTQKQWENSFSDHLGKFIDRLTEVDKIVLALLGGYSTVRLAPIVIQATGEAVIGAVAGA